MSYALALRERKRMNLWWLHLQQTRRLHLAVSVQTSVLGVHAEAVSVLQSLQLHELRLVFCCPFTSEVQQVWEPLQLQGLCTSVRSIT